MKVYILSTIYSSGGETVYGVYSDIEKAKNALKNDDFKWTTLDAEYGYIIGEHEYHNEKYCIEVVELDAK